MSDGIRKLNALPPDAALAALLQCCGSAKWAWQMVAERPFQDRDQLLSTADHAWWSLDPQDWLEAFDAHPKIGEKPSKPPTSTFSRWSEQEQSVAQQASAETLEALLNANREYEKRFGYIFIVCASGKTAEEMLDLLRDRLKNLPEAELRIAAEEQRRITNLRLEKLLNQ